MVEQHYKIRIRRNEVEIEVEGDKEFVEKHIEEFKKELPKIAKESSLKEKPVVSEIPKEKLGLEKLSLAEFYKRKQPKGHNETVVVFAYWLTKERNKEEFNSKDILDCYDEARMKKPKNINQHIIKMAAGKKAYLTSGSEKGLHKLILPGEGFVEKELPGKSEE